MRKPSVLIKISLVLAIIFGLVDGVCANPRIVSNSAHLYSGVCVAYAPNGKVLASGGQDQVVRIWDLEHRALVRPISVNSGNIFAIAFSPYQN